MTTDRSASVETSTSSAKTTTRRYWRRSDQAKPWWPGGLLPLLGLAGLFLFGAMVTAPRIEADVRHEVAQRVDGVGARITTVASDGQGVRIAASGSAESEPVIHAMAASATCETWAGRLTCPSVVDVALQQIEPVPSEPAARAHAFTITRAQNAVTLTGEVPSIGERDRIVNQAGSVFDIVNDQLTVSDELATTNYSRAADRALAVVGHLRDGSARWSGASLSVNGVAEATEVDPAYGQFTAMGSGSVLGDFDVTALQDNDGCNQEFANILGNASIRFRTASAEIDEGNDALLQSLAEQAGRCAADLRIAGHTDSRGDAGMNEALSQARADSVRNALMALGVDASRLTAVGFGESAPIADNTTAAGRAQNRRIVIEVLPENP